MRREQSSVLIAGGGIAGLAAAVCLQQRGFATTVVEQYGSLRPGGQAVDVRGVALQVVERLGLLTRIAQARTRMKGMTMLGPDGQEMWRSEERTLSAGRLDSEDIEMLRDDLQCILHSACEETKFFFGGSLVRVEQTNDHVLATFSDGVVRPYDLLIGADGLYAKSRALVFGSANEFVHDLGMNVAIFTTDNFFELEDWQVAMWGDAAGVLVYPARQNKELRVFSGFEGEVPKRGLCEAEYKALVTAACAGLGWEAPRLLDRMQTATDFYFGPMAQVRMDRWSSGRVVLLGDAGYCSSPKSGQGTSLALVGAYVLAQELSGSENHAAAFDRYEARMRPFVEKNQALALRVKNEPPSDEAVNEAKNFIQL